MIPIRLTLKNFLSYREATLDFRGLHTACICGANGAGKSSLLEAISWAVWGQSRAASEDDVVHIGAKEAQVDFTFVSQQRTYRIIRSRYRGQATGLEFQIAQGEGGIGGSDLQPQNAKPSFRSLTAKGVRATQQLVLEHIKLDYETFINSAYLRQGRADEFMLKRPSDRKQILADLLKLDQYDELAERARDQARQLKGQTELLERGLETIQVQLQQRDVIVEEQAALEALIQTTQGQQASDSDRLQALQTAQHQRQTWSQQLTWQRQQQRTLMQDCQRLQQEFLTAQHQYQELERLLSQESTIAAGYTYFQSLQSQEEELAETFNSYQRVQTQRQHYQHQQAEKKSELYNQFQQVQAQLEALVQQEAEIQQTLNKTVEVEAALTQLQQARSRLLQLDQLQTHVAPLLQRRQQLQNQLDRATTRLTARLEDLRISTQHLQTQQERQPQLKQAVLDVSDRIETLEQRRAYQQQVREKGLERRNFMERLQAHQRNYEAQLAEVEQKLQLLKQGVQATVEENGSPSSSSISTPLWLSASDYPPCPLCDRPLDEHHWKLVLEKHQIQQQEILDQIWTIREQLAASEREIQILRQEYRELDQELAEYTTVLERRGQLHEQLQTTGQVQTALRQVMQEAAELEQALQTGRYATELQEELHLLDHSLEQLNYDEKTHALARGEIDRWRWAEIRHAEIKQAQQRQLHIARQQPELQAQIAELQDRLEALNLETTEHLTTIEQQLTAIGYDLEAHNELRMTLRQAQPWQLHFQDLLRAKQNYPQVRQRIEELTQILSERQQHLQATQAQCDALVQYLEQTCDRQPDIQALEQQIQERRSQLDEQLSQLGRLQQQQQQLHTLSTEQADLKAQLQAAQRQYRIHQELTQAFGRNGIQTLMIENVLPQLEAETNYILSRLSANQLHVQFVTQRSNRRDQSRSAKGLDPKSKLIETLDILIADAQGTRPYETYSGGEAFRVNFAIRLALSRLLAQRSGTALQLLIIDEGFGTQDAEGCDRLIAAINAIAQDFACILTVTHVPHFKESFQSRIEVYKTENGSQLSLSI